MLRKDAQGPGFGSTIEKSLEERPIAPPVVVQMYTPEMWESVKDRLVQIQQGVFKNDAYSEEGLKKFFDLPRAHTLLLRKYTDSGEIIGFTTAFAERDHPDIAH